MRCTIQHLARLSLLIGLAFLPIRPAMAQVPEPVVVTSILPLQAIAAAVMEGLGEPRQIISASQSEHQYAPRPSDLALIRQAGLLLWIGPGLEHALAGAIRSTANPEAVLQVDTLEGLNIIRLKGGREPADPHYWLDTANARIIAAATAKRLSALAPAKASRYGANLAAFEQRLAELDRGIAARLAPHAAKPYLVYHDAFRYFEGRYKLAPRGAIATSPEQPPGAKRLGDIRAQIERDGIICIFAEPQLPTRNIDVVIEGTKARRGVIDGIGASVAPGPRAYEALMNGIANSLAACLGG